MSVNDKIYQALVSHGGGTINERVYNYLGSLGYTGTINERLSKYEHGGKRGWQGIQKGFGLSNAPGFLRHELFGQGQQGVMYVPQPSYLGNQILYQDAAGTTPVTADGDPTGLMLDLSRGLVRGPELVTNGGFDDGVTALPYVARGTITHLESSARLETTAPTSGFGVVAALEDPLISEAGTYEVVVKVAAASIADANHVLSVYRSTGQNSGVVSSDKVSGIRGPGTYRFQAEFVAGDTVTLRTENGAATIGDYWDLSSISVHELKGNHATQSTSAARPVYKTTGLLQQYDNVDDVMNVSLPSIAEATVITAKATGVEVQYPVDLSAGSYTIDESHSGIIIREGQLSASEQQKAIDYLSTMQGVA